MNSFGGLPLPPQFSSVQFIAQEGAMTGRLLYLLPSDKVKTCCSVVPCIVHLRWLNTLFSPLYREHLDDTVIDFIFSNTCRQTADVTIVIWVLAILIAFFCLVLTLHTYIHAQTHIPNSVRATKLLYQLLYCFWYQQQRTSSVWQVFCFIYRLILFYHHTFFKGCQFRCCFTNHWCAATGVATSTSLYTPYTGVFYHLFASSVSHTDFAI